jgi:hypothetical protein
MDVGVKDRLPCYFPAIYANVKSLRLKLLLDYIPDLSDKLEDVRIFLHEQIPDGRDVSLWKNERVTVRNWETV